MDRYISKKPKLKKSDKTKKVKGTKGTKGLKGMKGMKGTKRTKKGSGYSETKAKWDERNRIKHQKRLDKRLESRTRHAAALQQKNLLRQQARMQRRENTDAKVARMRALAKARREQYFNKIAAIRNSQMIRRHQNTHVVNMR